MHRTSPGCIASDNLNAQVRSGNGTAFAVRSIVSSPQRQASAKYGSGSARGGANG
ncbi:hypothetical protein XHC_3031 [Xanthomonas hortorum pv. carotae str. M081]|nr:hypothetical protein XHC_3031 [Xanthomonas hortorum pv. carotae str. M081]